MSNEMKEANDQSKRGTIKIITTIINFIFPKLFHL